MFKALSLLKVTYTESFEEMQCMIINYLKVTYNLKLDK